MNKEQLEIILRLVNGYPDPLTRQEKAAVKRLKSAVNNYCAHEWAVTRGYLDGAELKCNKCGARPQTHKELKNE